MDPSSPFTPPFNLTASYNLSDDYVLTADVLVAPSSPAPVGVFIGNNQPQALIVRANGVLCALAPTSGQSSAGWATTPIGSATGVTQAAAGVQNDGSVHGFYTDASHLYHISWDNGTWSAPDTTLPACSGLKVTNNFITGQLVAYGVDAGGNLLFVTQSPGNGAWNANCIKFPSSLGGTTPVLMLTSAVDDWVMALPGTTTSSGGTLAVYQGTPTALTSGPAQISTQYPVQQVITGFWTNNSALFLFTDNRGSLFANVGATLTLIPGMTVTQGAAVVDFSNNIHLFTVDQKGIIWVTHQTRWSSTTGPVWAPSIPLDVGFTALFTDANPMDTAAFFGVDAEGAVWHYVLDSNAQQWTYAKARMPSQQTYNLAQYRTEITVVDQNGNPVPNLDIAVGANALSSVLVKGLFYPVSASQTVTVTTNGQGRATLSTVAHGVSTPQLTFTAANVTAPTVNPAAGVHTYLRGTGTLNPGTSATLPQFSPTTLQQAQVGGAPLAPAVQGNSQLATAAAGGITTMFNLSTGGSRATVFKHPTETGITGFVLDLSNPAQPVFQVATSEEEFQALRAQALELGPLEGVALPESLGSWWDDVKDFFEDIWHGIKNAAIAVTKWVVHAIDATVDLVVKIGDEIKQIAALVVKGIEDVVSMVQSIFAAIETAVEELIDWLKMLFDWQHILDTKNALEQGLAKAFPWLQNEISVQGGELVNGFFTKLEKTVGDAFDAMIAQFADGQTLGSLSGGVGNAAYAWTGTRGLRVPPAALIGKVTSADLSTLSTVHNNWLFEKLESFFGGGPAFQTVDGLQQPLETLKNTFETVMTHFLDALQDFWKFVKTAISDPKHFATIGIKDFLTAAKDVALGVLAFLDGIFVAFLEVLGAAAGGAGRLLTTPFEIPIISGIVDAIADLLGIKIPPISVAGMFCFAFAIPVTIFYKLKNGVNTEPFPGGVLPMGDLSMDADAAAPGSVEQAMIFTAMGIAALWALMDTGLDAVPDVNLMVFKILDVVAPTLLQIFTWPSGIPFTAIPMDTPADKAGLANWIVTWCLIGFDIALLVTSSITWEKGSTIARYNDPVGKIVMSAMGAINLVAGIVASSLGDVSGGAIAANILGPLPPLFQFLRLESLEEASEEITLAAKLVIDFFAGEGYAVALAATA